MFWRFFFLFFLRLLCVFIIKGYNMKWSFLIQGRLPKVRQVNTYRLNLLYHIFRIRILSRVQFDDD